ncbi:MAG TPA: hypothetical protein VMR34_05465 [Candidatus Saccharimonadales bacterium]|nr:hypothetical protein [Candidatus Saccharimonadales bacterium]
MTGGYLKKILYQKRKTMIWWFAGLVGVTFFTIIFFPALKNSNLGQVFNTLPKGLQQVTGGANTFSSIGGYIAQEIFALREPLLLIILSILLFNNLYVSEERKGLLEAQISLPLTRKKIFLTKLVCAILVVVVASVGIVVGVKLGLISIHTHYSLLKIIQESLECLLISLDFGLVALLLSSIFGTKGIVTGLSTTFAFGSYLISSMAPTVKSLQGIDKLSPFHYYQNLEVFNKHNTEVLAIFGLVLIVLSFIFFVRRDIKT